MKKTIGMMIVLYLLAFQFTSLYGSEPPEVFTSGSAIESSGEASAVDTTDTTTEANILDTTDTTTEANALDTPNAPEATSILEEAETFEILNDSGGLETSQYPNVPTVTAEAAVLMDAKTGLILYNKNKDIQHYPASITKIMTALLTLEMCGDNLLAAVPFSYNAVHSLPRAASHIAMDEGETLSVIDALYGLLLASANEVANALAEYISDDIDEFALLMNKKAAALGATNTQFENPSGLYTPGHYTTAHDMARILQAAVKYPVFNEIIAARRYDIQPTEKQPLVRELLNSNKLIQPGSFFNEWVVGGKTGFTDEAQHTLASYAVKDGRELIVVVMYDEKSAAYTDTNALFEYGFSIPYTNQTIFDSRTYARTIPVYQTNGEEKIITGQVTLKATQDVTLSLPDSFDPTDVRYELNTPQELSPPIFEGDELGSVTCYIQNIPIKTVAMLAENAVMPVTFVPVPTPFEAEAMDTIAPAEEGSAENTSFHPDKNYWATLIVPLCISGGILLLTLLVLLIKKVRRRAVLARYGRYTRVGKQVYRYRPLD